MNMDEYYKVIKKLPEPVAACLQQIPPKQAADIHDIRLRSGRPVILCRGNHSFLAPSVRGFTTVSHELLQECCLALCDYSLHSIQRTLVQGYFTLDGGHRVGVAGAPVYKDGCLQGYRTFYSLNIRIAHHDNYSLDEKVKSVFKDLAGSILIIGPPSSGKTTLLRSAACFMSYLGRKVSIVDSRKEIFPASLQGYKYEVPINCDVLEGYPRAEGIEIALRSLSPSELLCDEVGTAKDVQALEMGVSAGVRITATLHGASLQEVRHRPQFRRLEETGAFRSYIFLSGAGNPGTVKEICTLW